MAYEYKGLGFSDEDIQSIENSVSNGKLTTTITLKDGSTTISSAETALPAATTSVPGLMSAADKTKLDGVAENANNYTHPTYSTRTYYPTANATPAFGGTFIVSQITTDTTGHVSGATSRTVKIPNTAASTSDAGLVKIGDNITISSGTISLTKTNVTNALGYTPPTTNTTYESKNAASNGTDVSLVTTGEKYTWNNKQDKLVSGTNIKTINGTSLLGNGNIEISGGSGGSTEVPTYDFGNLGNKEYNTWTYTSSLTETQAEALKDAKYVTFTYVDSDNGYIYKLYCWLVGENQRVYTKTYQAEYGSYVYTVLNKSYQTSGGIWQNLSFDITKSQKETGGSTSTEPVEQETTLGNSGQWNQGDYQAQDLSFDTSVQNLSHSEITGLTFSCSATDTNGNSLISAVYQIPLDAIVRRLSLENSCIYSVQNNGIEITITYNSSSFSNGTDNISFGISIVPNWSYLSHDIYVLSIYPGFTYKGLKYGSGGSY